MGDLLSPQVCDYLDGLVPARPPELERMEAYAREYGFPIIGPACGHLCYQLARVRWAMPAVDRPRQQLEDLVGKASKAATKTDKKTRRKMSAAQKKAISARMKKYWAAKKQAKQ